MSTTAMTLDRQSLLDAAESTPRLLAALDCIAVEGWNSSTGDVVLAYARREVVRPAVRSAGLTGSAAEAAAASGWSAAWEALAAPSIRSAASPWGFVTTAVRRAVLGERMAERYRTATRTAWRVEQFQAEGGSDQRRPGGWRAVADSAALARPLSLTALVDEGYDRPITDQLPSDADPTMDLLVAVLVRGGWSPAVARETVLHVAEHGLRNRPDEPEVPGWRSLAVALGVPGWQARRLTVLLLGAPGWPGLVERLATGGASALRGPVIDVAVRATWDAGLRTPARTAPSQAMPISICSATTSGSTPADVRPGGRDHLGRRHPPQRRQAGRTRDRAGRSWRWRPRCGRGDLGAVDVEVAVTARAAVLARAAIVLRDLVPAARHRPARGLRDPLALTGSHPVRACTVMA